MDKNSGVISGTPTKAGDYVITVRYYIDGWVAAQAAYELTVVSAAETDPGTGEVDLSGIQAAIDSLEDKVAALEDGADVSDIEAAITQIKADIEALKGEGSDVDLSGIEAAIDALEGRVDALENAEPAEEGGCGSVINGVVALAVAVPAIACAAYVLRRRNADK